MILAVSEVLWGEVNEPMVRMSTGLGGGIGGSYEESCGALTAGVMLIGARYGRVRAGEDDAPCYTLAARYRERFVRELGAGRCSDLRGPDGYGSQGKEPCSVLVSRAATILLEIIEEGDEIQRSSGGGV